MTSPLPHDDEDSLYDQPIVKSPVNIPNETIIPREQALHIDTLLDSEETPPPSKRNSITSLSDSDTSAIHQPAGEQIPSPYAPTPVTSPHNDELFDSDENHISTSSSSSSSSTTTIPERPSRDEPPPFKISLPKSAPSFLSRASATFYKAFRKKKPVTVFTPTPPTDQTHETLVKLFEAQIATLRSARTGFVDLAMVTPMTQRTLEGVHQAATLLRDFALMERNVTTLRRKVEVNGREMEAEIRAKEKLLVDAKIRLAEVSEDVERLRHELRRVQKVLSDPRRADRRRIREVRREAVVCREARKDVEKRLAEKMTELGSEKSKLAVVENDFRDIEGDWA